MATASCVEEDILLFSGERLKCRNKLTFSRGQYGSWHLGLWKTKKSEEEVVAIKQVQKHDCVENWEDVIGSFSSGSLNHKNVINVFGFEDDIENWRYFAVELCRASLEQYCTREYEGPMPSDANVLSQISSGIDYLHEMGYAHGHLNPHTILISQSLPVQMKVSDFGLYVNMVTKGEQDDKEDLTDPKYWTLSGTWSTSIENGCNRMINTAATVYGDVFAAGCLLFYFLKRGLHPFGSDAKSILANITNNYPVNLKRLYESHFAFQSIKKMIDRPLNNGTQFLRLAAAHLREFALKIEKPYRLAKSKNGKDHNSNSPTVADKNICSRCQLLEPGFLPVTRQFKEIVRSIPEKAEKGLTINRFHPNLPILACGSYGGVRFFTATDGSIPFLNWESKVYFELQDLLSHILALEWNVNGNLLAAGDDFGDLILWEYPSGELLFLKTFVKSEIVLIVWNPYSQEVFATLDSCNKTLRLWNSVPSENKIELCIIKREVIITVIKWIFENQFALGFSNGWIEICKIEITKTAETTTRVVKRFIHGSYVLNIQWNGTLQYMAACFLKDLSIKIWAMDNLDEPIHSLPMHSNCRSLAWYSKRKSDDGIDLARKSPENFILVCGTYDGSIVIWNPLETDLIKRKHVLLKTHSDRVNVLSFSPDNRFLVSADAKDEIFIWLTETWNPLFSGKCNRDRFHCSWLSNPSSTDGDSKFAINSPDENKIRILEYAEKDN